MTENLEYLIMVKLVQEGIKAGEASLQKLANTAQTAGVASSKVSANFKAGSMSMVSSAKQVNGELGKISHSFKENVLSQKQMIKVSESVSTRLNATAKAARALGHENTRVATSFREGNLQITSSAIQTSKGLKNITSSARLLTPALEKTNQVQKKQVTISREVRAALLRVAKAQRVLGIENGRVTAIVKKGGLQSTASARQTSKGLEDVRVSTKRLNEAQKTGAGYSQDFTRALKRVLIVVPIWMAVRGVIRAVTTTIRNSFQAMKDLTSGLARAQAVARGSTTEVAAAMKILRHEAIEFARANKGTEKDVTEAFHRMGTAGIDLKIALAGSVPVAKLANATYANIVETGRAVAGVYRTLGDTIQGTSKEEEKIQVITDVLATAWSHHRITLNEVEKALANVSSQSKRFNLSMQETIAVIAVSSDNLIAGGRAGRLFGRILDDMVNKLPEVQRLLGTTFKKNVQIEWLDVFKQVVTKINELGEGTVQAEEALASIFNIRARRQAGLFLKDMNEVVKALDRFGIKSKGMAQSLIDIRNATPEAQLEMVNTNISVLVRNFTTGVMGATSFVEALIQLNSQLKSVSENALIAGTFMNQMGINIKAIPKLIGAWIGSLTAVADEVMKGAITVQQADEIMLKAIDEALEGAKDLHEAEVEALVKFRQEVVNATKQMELLKTIQEKIAKAAKDNPIVPTEGDMNRRLKTLKAYGATEVQLAEERIRYLKEILEYDEEDEKVIDARIKLLEVEQAVLRKNADIIKGVFTKAVRLSLDTGDLTDFANSFREGLRGAVLDAVAEGFSNQVLEATGLSEMLGGNLAAIKMGEAFEVGGTTAAMKMQQALSGGVGGDALHVGSGLPSKFMAPANYYKTQGAEQGGLSSFMTDFKKLAGIGLMGASLFSGGGGDRSTSQRYATAPGARTSTATTRSTTIAKVTNITIAPIFELDGVSINDKKTIEESANKLAIIVRDQVVDILQTENVALGN